MSWIVESFETIPLKLLVMSWRSRRSLRLSKPSFYQLICSTSILTSHKFQLQGWYHTERLDLDLIPKASSLEHHVWTYSQQFFLSLDILYLDKTNSRPSTASLRCLEPIQHGAGEATHQKKQHKNMKNNHDVSLMSTRMSKPFLFPPSDNLFPRGRLMKQPSLFQVWHDLRPCPKQDTAGRAPMRWEVQGNCLARQKKKDHVFMAGIWCIMIMTLDI